jgi:hypothetical protein
MKTYFITHCLLSLLVFMFEKQKDITTLTEEKTHTSKSKVLNKKGNCTFTNKYSLTERLNFYPFNKAIEVKIVSFKHKNFDKGQYTARLTENNKIDYRRIDEIKTLNTTQIDSLTNLFYNFGLKPNATPNNEAAKCYEPRNGILFINEDYQVFEWIEICFGCGRERISNDTIKLGDACPYRYFLLKDFFRRSGIEYVEE